MERLIRFGGSMRGALWFAAGLVVGLATQAGSGQPRDIVSLNHVALSVEDFEGAKKFYTETMGFPEAFEFREPDGKPYLSYLQINRQTFIELMGATATRPPGFVHFGLEVADVDSVARRLRERGVQVGNASVSPRTKSRIAVGRTPHGTTFELLEFGPDSLHRRVMERWK